MWIENLRLLDNLSLPLFQPESTGPAPVGIFSNF